MTLEIWNKRKQALRNKIRWMARRGIASRWFLVQYFSHDQRKTIVLTGDPVRYGTVELALLKIEKDRIPGSLAECGVYKGALSKFIHDCLPHRRFYLFDTFQGFDSRDSDTLNDERFRKTSVELIQRHLGNTENIIIRKGYFPETAIGLEQERFAFVMIDFDKFEPMMAALHFFYPRTETGGYIFVHDYLSPESNGAPSRALDKFLADKPEFLIQTPDKEGTALFRKS